MLFTNTDAVVRESLWELGVLRALGLSAAQLLRVAVYEALASTLAAVALGAAAGLQKQRRKEKKTNPLDQDCQEVGMGNA